MRERAPNGRKLGQGWGNGEDLLARPTDKAMRIVRELLKWHGLASEVTDMTPGEGAGGVMIVWDSTAMMRAGATAATARNCGTNSKTK